MMVVNKVAMARRSLNQIRNAYADRTRKRPTSTGLRVISWQTSAAWRLPPHPTLSPDGGEGAERSCLAPSGGEGGVRGNRGSGRAQHEIHMHFVIGKDDPPILRAVEHARLIVCLLS